MSKKETNWQPEHFPVGTVVLWSVHEEEKYFKEATVKSIVRNGPNSYCLKTGEMEQFSDGSLHEETINTSHVKKIIKRGEGKVVFEKPYVSPNHKGFLIERYGKNVIGSKNHYFCYDIQSLLLHLVSIKKQDRHTDVFSYLIAAHALAKQTFFHSKYEDGLIYSRYINPDSRPFYLYFSVDKKRIQKWFKQNYNRFLLSPVKVQKEQDEEYNRRYYEDMEREFDE